MILVITTSVDRTADMVVGCLPPAEVFRFNADLLTDYQVEFTPGRFYIRDPVGREVTSDSVTACYFRKLDWPVLLDVPAGGSPENWMRKNQSLFAHELYNWFRGTDRIVLEIGAHHDLGKISQMNLAREFFPVAPWFAGVSSSIHGLPFAGNCVSKSLSNTFIQNFKGHQVSRVDARRLDPKYPWFLQEMTPAGADITVAYVNGKCFAYACPRAAEDVDCRTTEKFYQWVPAQLSAPDVDAVRAFMRRARLNFGRLDFLQGHDGRLHFLECNTNGQWGWLDLQGDNGLLDAVVGEILVIHRRNHTI